MTLTGNQKRQLKTRAHDMKPLIQIGKNGLTPAQLETIKQALKQHELIKIKFNDYKSQKTELSQQIAQETEAETVDIIGNTLILYKKKT